MRAPCSNRANAGIGPDVWVQNRAARGARGRSVSLFLRGASGDDRRTVDRRRSKSPAHASARATDSSSPKENFPPILPRRRGSLTRAQRPRSRLCSTASLRARDVRRKPGMQPQLIDAGCLLRAYGPRQRAERARDRPRSEQSRWGPTQQRWLAAELAAVAGREAAVVVGDADLAAAMAAHDASATEVVNTMIAGRASAYFYDSPERTSSPLTTEQGSVESFRSGALGYVHSPTRSNRTSSARAAPASGSWSAERPDRRLRSRRRTDSERRRAHLKRSPARCSQVSSGAVPGSRPAPAVGNLSGGRHDFAADRPVHADPRRMRRRRLLTRASA